MEVQRAPLHRVVDQLGGQPQPERHLIFVEAVEGLMKAAEVIILHNVPYKLFFRC